MRNRILAILVCMTMGLMFSLTAYADVDLHSMSDAELVNLIQQAQSELYGRWGLTVPNESYIQDASSGRLRVDDLVGAWEKPTSPGKFRIYIIRTGDDSFHLTFYYVNPALLSDGKIYEYDYSCRDGNTYFNTKYTDREYTFDLKDNTLQVTPGLEPGEDAPEIWLRSTYF